MTPPLRGPVSPGKMPPRTWKGRPTTVEPDAEHAGDRVGGDASGSDRSGGGSGHRAAGATDRQRTAHVVGLRVTERVGLATIGAVGERALGGSRRAGEQHEGERSRHRGQRSLGDKGRHVRSLLIRWCLFSVLRAYRSHAPRPKHRTAGPRARLSRKRAAKLLVARIGAVARLSPSSLFPRFATTLVALVRSLDFTTLRGWTETRHQKPKPSPNGSSILRTQSTNGQGTAAALRPPFSRAVNEEESCVFSAALWSDGPGRLTPPR